MNTHGKMGKESVQRQGVAVGEPVWVQCEGFRCLAYLDDRGDWRALFDNTKLTDVIRVLSIPKGSNHEN
jgi:hypothetical protein